MHLRTSDTLQWFFACPQFIEPLLADELTALGAEAVKIGYSGVQATGDLAMGYRVVLWSRLASRATLQVASGKASNQDELRELLLGITWEDHLHPNGSLKVRFLGRTEDLRNTQFGAQWVKDQIVDYFTASHGVRPSVSNDPDINIVVNLHKGQGTVGIEINAQSLHHRGYRQPGAKAPLRENLGAAVLIRAGWLEQVASEQAPIQLIDPMCGSGTLLIEGALMAFDWAPGLLRQDNLARRWLGHDQALWDGLVAEAEERRDEKLKDTKRFEFWGNDADTDMFNLARRHWRSIGLPEARWSHCDIAAMPGAAPTATGLVVCNPPYGERLSSVAELKPLYEALGAFMSSLSAAFQGAIFTQADVPITLSNLYYSKEYRLMNGDLECKLFRFESLAQKERPAKVLAEDLANRITKNLRKLKPFIKSGVTNAYRVYDADIPEYSIAVDRYGDWLHVQEYAPPKDIDPNVAQKRLNSALMTLPEVLSIPADQVVLKQRKQQKGSSQYEKQDDQRSTGNDQIVFEHGARFIINLTDYLDTGLFLDHRPMRYWLQQQAKDKVVLNLFCYTGAASVHAAMGGASRVDSVDLSNTYLEWAKENFRLNKLKPERFNFIQADVVEWLADAQSKYDLIFLDPPTFSNSKRMRDHFDVQRDHQELIDNAMKVLVPDGTLVFSNNFRKFKMDEAVLANYDVQDYRQKSIPADYERNQKIHGCWLIKHRV